MSRRQQTKSDGIIQISTGGGHINLQSAPFGANVSTGGGEIRIGSAKKSVKASTGGGDISIESMDGSLKASTGAGDISVKLTGDSSASDHHVDLSSGKGDITLYLPNSFSAVIDVKPAYTRGYEDSRIVSDFDLQQERTTQWSSEEGTPRKYIYGKGRLGSGRNRIRVETVNGNVYLKRSKW